MCGWPLPGPSGWHTALCPRYGRLSKGRATRGQRPGHGGRQWGRGRCPTGDLTQSRGPHGGGELEHLAPAVARGSAQHRARPGSWFAGSRAGCEEGSPSPQWRLSRSAILSAAACCHLSDVWPCGRSISLCRAQRSPLSPIWGGVDPSGTPAPSSAMSPSSPPVASRFCPAQHVAVPKHMRGPPCHPAPRGCSLPPLTACSPLPQHISNRLSRVKQSRVIYRRLSGPSEAGSGRAQRWRQPLALIKFPSSAG